MLPDTPLEEGGRVQLVNLQAKTGQTGTLVKHNTDGKWKVRMDIDGGVALLQDRYLVAIADTTDAAPASRAKETGASRREKLKAKVASAKEQEAAPITA